MELLWYLMDGSHDLAGFLVQDVRTPVRVEKVQLFNQPVVLSQEERVQRNHSQMFISSGITWEKFTYNNRPCRPRKAGFSLTSLKTGSVVAQTLRSVGATARNSGASGATGVQVGLHAGQEGHVGQILVGVLSIQRHGAQRRGQVPESQRQSSGAAVHHARVHEGGDGVELLPVVLRQDSSNAAGRRAEERHAALGAVARIRERNLKNTPTDLFHERSGIHLRVTFGRVGHLYGEAGRLLVAAVRAVGSGPEGGCAGALRRLHDVMIDPLAPLHQQVGQGGVQRDVVVASEQHLLGDPPHLRTPAEVTHLAGERRAEGAPAHSLTGGRVALW